MSDLKRLFVCLHEYRRDLILGMVLVLVETFFELVIPVLMANLIDVGVANRDVHYILVKGGQMGVCAVLALVAGLMYARFAARAACGWGAEHPRGGVPPRAELCLFKPRPLRDLRPRHPHDDGRDGHPERHERRAPAPGAQPADAGHGHRALGHDERAPRAGVHRLRAGAGSHHVLHSPQRGTALLGLAACGG